MSTYRLARATLSGYYPPGLRMESWNFEFALGLGFRVSDWIDVVAAPVGSDRFHLE
jgi:hypothetical protein